MLFMHLLLFIVRQIYAHAWRTLHDHEDMTHWCRNISESLNEIDQAFMTEIDKREMVLH